MEKVYQSEKKEKIKKLFYGMLLFAFFVFVITFSQRSREQLISTLEMCAQVLVPAIFPLAVFGNLVGSGIAEFPRFLLKIISKMFGVGERGAKALLPGLFAGFPVGCSGAAGLFERGEIGENEFDRICALSLTPGAAFVISGVGEGMFGSKKIGLLIYFCIIISVFTVGFFTRGKGWEKAVFSTSDEEKNEDRVKLSAAIVSSIVKSANSMLVMSAFVAFFSQISLAVNILCERLWSSEILLALLNDILEVSSACRASADVSGNIGIISAVFACAFGGLSVYMQTLAVGARCAGKKTFIYMLIFRIFVTLVSVILCAIFLRFFDLT